MSKKAALYIRVSTVYQVDKDSLPMQRKDLIAYAHHVLGIDDYDVFEDAGYSGKNVERPAFKEMMRRCRLGEFSHVLVWKIDRISRNLLDFAAMYDELKKLGVSLISKNEQFDTSTPMGEASLKILLVFAELERKTTSERVAATMLTRAKDGKWNGANIPYGYEYNKETKYPVLNEKEAEVVKAIFSNYASMRSLVKVVKWLMDNGYTTKHGGKWFATTVKQIINNPFYIGTLRYNMTHGATRKSNAPEDVIVVENAHPALIDKALFEKCNRILAANSSFLNKDGKHKNVIHTNIFAGLLKCGCCGRSLKAQIKRVSVSGIRYASYTCASRFSENSKPCSNPHPYHDKVIGGFVLNYISNIINAKKAIKKMRSPKELERFLLTGKDFADVVGIAEIDSLYMSLKIGSAFANGANNDVVIDTKQTDSIKKEIQKKERALERLNKLFLYDEEAMPEAEYIVTKNKLRQEILQLNEKLSEMSAPAQTISDDVFISNASNFILLKIFESAEYVEFTEVVELVDKPALKEFAMSVISKITTNNRHITSIEFSNGSTHHFAYK